MNRRSDVTPTPNDILRDASKHLFASLHGPIGAGTFFVAEHDGAAHRVVSSWSRKESMLREGDRLSFQGACEPLAGGQARSVIVHNTALGALTANWTAARRRERCSFAGAPIVLRDGRVFGAVCAIDRVKRFTQRDAKELEQVAALLACLIELELDLIHDAMTGVYHRGYVDLLFASPEGKRIKAAAFLDLDAFMKINETHGYQTGNEVLRRVGLLLREYAERERLIACRYTGDEFLLLFLEQDREEEILAVVRRMSAQLSEPMPVGGASVQVSASIGVCLEADSLHEFVQRADTAMYQAKKLTGQGLKVFRIAQQDKDLEHALREALAEEQFRLYYQSIVDFRRQGVVSLEALLRWDRPGAGIVGPDHFLPCAERMGLIQQIDLWVIREVCRTFSVRSGNAGFGKKIHVNVSVKALRDPNFVDAVEDILAESGFPAKKLVIELNEATSMADVTHIRPQILRMVSWGISFSLDDFGQGSSSLGILKLLPIHSIKIDRFFVIDILHDPVSEAIVAGLASIAEALNIRLIAEGVETEEQFRRMKQLGCDQLQGYYIGRPMPLDKGALASPAGDVRLWWTGKEL